MGGTNDPSNLIQLTISEHAAWHYELWVYYGFHQDYMAWKALSGQMTQGEVWLETCKLGGIKLRGRKRPQEYIEKYMMGVNNPNYGNRGPKHPLYKPRIPKICVCCGNEFECPQRFPNQIYCSHKCHRLFTTKKIWKNCLCCGTAIFGLSKQKYCSRSCTSKMNKNRKKH